MTAFIARRLLLMALVLVLVSFVAFAVTRFIPGDPLNALSQGELGGNMTPEMRAQYLRLYELDKSTPLQYVGWVSRIVRGDLGRSQATAFPIGSEIKRRLGITAELALLSMTLALAVALPLGVLTAMKKDTAVDFFGTVFALVGVSAPNFLIATVLLLLFALYLPFQIYSGYVPFSEDPAEHFKRLLLPVVTLGFGAAATLTRLTRSAVLEVLGQDYVRTARAKGLPESTTLRRHALRNALIPVMTVSGIQVGHLLGGAIIVETVYTLPGLGSYLIMAVRARDYPVLQALLLLLTAIFILVNLLVDMAYSYLDPRIRHQ
jgi:peptide/nickel transport system permease protein